MKGLYESILDDEDILIDDVKKSSNDFNVIQYLCKEGEFDKLIKICNDGFLDKFIKDILYINPKELRIDGRFRYGFYVVKYFISYNEKLVLLEINYSLGDNKLYISIPDNDRITNFQHTERLDNQLKDQLNNMYNKRNKITRSIKKLGFTKSKTQFPYMEFFEKN